MVLSITSGLGPVVAEHGANIIKLMHIALRGQIIFDDVFFLLMLGLVVPTLFYIVWGLWSTSVIPVF